MGNKRISVDVFYYCYNQERYIERALDSIVAQSSLLELNLIICDDASTDDSSLVINKWIDKNMNLITKLGWTVSNLSHPAHNNIGQVATLKEGISHCKAEYFAILEGDDYWIGSSHLDTSTRVLKENNFLTGVFSSWISMNSKCAIMEIRSPGNREYVDTLFDFNKLISFNAPATLSCMVYRGSSLKSVRHYAESDPNLSDFSLNLTISTLGPIQWLNGLSVQYTFDSESLWRKIPLREQRLITAGIIEDRLEALQIEDSNHARNAIAYLKLTKNQEVRSFALRHPVKFGIVAVRKVIEKLF